MKDFRVRNIKQKGYKHCFCNSKCQGKWHTSQGNYILYKAAWKTFMRMEQGFSVPIKSRNVNISGCYLKEARAMLAGRNTAGKNKCVKLDGDE
jgi:hypothetical protein